MRFRDEFEMILNRDDFKELEFDHMDGSEVADNPDVDVYTTLFEVEEDDVPYLAQIVFEPEDLVADVCIAKPIKHFLSVEVLRKVNAYNCESRFCKLSTEEGMLSLKASLWKAEGVEALMDMLFMCMDSATETFPEFESDK
ncbi:hypothetical protein SAMN02910358_00951 [Lachnospiraceae bacterium XBB1006]|nr:hypothetical protein SAMN02910358_00951 [Lachnospiraceae bacterium XBB1006]